MSDISEVKRTSDREVSTADNISEIKRTDDREVIAVGKQRNRKKSEYNESMKQSSIKYRKAHQRPVALSYVDSEWEEVVYPAIQKTGEPIATFIKKAVRQRIERENL